MANKDAKVPKVDGANFTFWQVKMENYLMSLGVKVWLSIIDGYTIPSPLQIDLDINHVYVANAKDLNYITSGLSDSKFTKVMGIKVAKDTWDKLIHNYEGDGKVKKENLQTYKRYFESLKMNDEECVAAYFLLVDEVVNFSKAEVMISKKR